MTAGWTDVGSCRVANPAPGCLVITKAAPPPDLYGTAGAVIVSQQQGGRVHRIRADGIAVELHDGASLSGGGVVLESPFRVTRLDAADDRNLGGLVGSLDGCDGGMYYATEDHPRRKRGIPDGPLSRRGWTAIGLSADGTWCTLVPGGDGDPGTIAVFAYGTDYGRAMKAFTSVTGPVPLLPRWAMGLMFSQFMPFTPQDYKDIVDGFRNRGMPIDVIICDMNWHGDGWYSLAYNPVRFPDMPGFLAWAHDEKLHVGFNHHTGLIEAQDPRSREFIRRTGIDPEKVKTVLEGLDMYRYNLSDPVHFQALWDIYLKPMMDDGVDFHWVDGGPDLNALIMYFESAAQATGKRPLVLTRQRDGSLQHHRYPCGFSGDTLMTWATLRFGTRVSITGANCGVWWSHDVGGHHWEPGTEPHRPGMTPELFARWIQGMALQPIFRFHGQPNEGVPCTRKPWEWGDDVLCVAQAAFALRYRLLPYTYTHARLAMDSGVPPVRGLWFLGEDPANPDACYRYDSFAVGEDLVVAPIFEPMTESYEVAREVWLPSGEWVSDRGERFAGPCTITTAGDIMRIPHFFRAGAPIPEGEYRQSSQDPQETLRVRLFVPGAEGAWDRLLYEDDGESLACRDGAGAFTQLRCRHSGRETALSLAEAGGAMNGASLRRGIEVLVHFKVPPSGVALNGRPLAESDADTGWSVRNGILTIRRRPDPGATTVEIAITWQALQKES